MKFFNIVKTLLKVSLLLILLAVIVFVAYSMLPSSSENKKTAITPNYSNGLSAEERVMAAQAFVVFLDACRPLMKEYLVDIESVDIENGFDRNRGVTDDGCLDYRCRDYGWDKQIYIKIKLKDQLFSIPRELRAQGHTLHFYLGGPKNPGITVGKFPELCGAKKPTDGSFDVYISKPKLAFIK